MANLSILSSFFSKTSIKKLNKLETSIQNFLNDCYEEYAVYPSSYDSDYEAILRVESVKNGVKLFCTLDEKFFIVLPNKFLQFGLQEDETIPFYKWYKIFEFCLIDLDKSLDFDDLRFSGK